MLLCSIDIGECRHRPGPFLCSCGNLCSICVCTTPETLGKRAEQNWICMLLSLLLDQLLLIVTHGSSAILPTDWVLCKCGTWHGTCLLGLANQLDLDPVPHLQCLFLSWRPSARVANSKEALEASPITLLSHLPIHPLWKPLLDPLAGSPAPSLFQLFCFVLVLPAFICPGLGLSWHGDLRDGAELVLKRLF